MPPTLWLRGTFHFTERIKPASRRMRERIAAPAKAAGTRPSHGNIAAAGRKSIAITITAPNASGSGTKPEPSAGGRAVAVELDGSRARYEWRGELRQERDEQAEADEQRPPRGRQRRDVKLRVKV